MSESRESPAARSESGWFAVRQGLAVYLVTGLLVLTGLVVGCGLVAPATHRRSPLRVPATGNQFWDAVTQWDGQWYIAIASEGYTYNPEEMSSVAFFPFYPILGGALATMTGMRTDVALLIVAQFFLVATFVLLFAYVRHRFPESSHRLAMYVVMALAFFPTTFFARMVYTESLFLFLCVLTLYGIEKRWPLLVIATVIALASATRPVGVGLLLPFALFVWEQSRPRWKAAWRLSYLTPWAVSGLLFYLAFQWLAFDEPLAFTKTQRHWQTRPAFTTGDKWLALASWEPIWSAYDSSSPTYWAREGRDGGPLFNLRFADPIYLVLAAALVYVGVWKSWLSRYEILLAVALLFIPYVTAAYNASMQSQGRYASVVVPAYLVLGQLFFRAPVPVALGILAVFGTYLGIYAAMFAGGYLFI